MYYILAELQGSEALGHDVGVGANELGNQNF
jgi:hypothetical protein